jgi:hypothetical protein
VTAFLTGEEWARWARTATPAEIGADITAWLKHTEAEEAQQARDEKRARLQAESAERKARWLAAKDERRRLTREWRTRPRPQYLQEDRP